MVTLMTVVLPQTTIAGLVSKDGRRSPTRKWGQMVESPIWVFADIEPGGKESFEGQSSLTLRRLKDAQCDRECQGGT